MKTCVLLGALLIASFASATVLWPTPKETAKERYERLLREAKKFSEPFSFDRDYIGRECLGRRSQRTGHCLPKDAYD
jgi:hypothetical protein